MQVESCEISGHGHPLTGRGPGGGAKRVTGGRDRWTLEIDQGSLGMK